MWLEEREAAGRAWRGKQEALQRTQQVWYETGDLVPV